MQRSVPTPGRLLVMVGFALSCFGLLLFLWLAFGGPVPFKPKGYRFDATFQEATQLSREADVAISGVRVGKVKEIESTDEGSVATIELQERFAPLPRDSRAILRQKTLLGETYVEISPGTRGSGMLPEGGSLRRGAVSPTVELDEIFRAFDERTRRDFQVWMQTLATGVRGRGRDISNALGNLAPFAEDTNRLLTVLNSQEGAVSALVRNTGEVFGALGERNGQLADLVVNSNRVFETTARRDRELREIFTALPTFERESATTVTRLARFARETNPLVTQLRPAARELSPTLRDLSKLAPDLKGFFRDLNPLITASRTGLPALRRFLEDLRPMLGQLDPFLRSLNPILEGVAAYRKELGAFFSNSVAATQATDVPTGATAPIHYLRTTNPLNAENLANYPRRVGTNRPNPYTFPGAFNELATGGMKVYEDRHCGNGNPTIAPTGTLTAPVAALLPTELRGLLDQFVFSQAGTAPPCVRQGRFQSRGDPVETTDYTHVRPDARP